MRFERSDHGYGWHLWIGQRIRIASRKALTPMWPHIYRSWDENCNRVLAFHGWPLGGLDIWLSVARTDADGRCDECIQLWAQFDADRESAPAPLDALLGEHEGTNQ